MKMIVNDGTEYEYQVERSQDNVRLRPGGRDRHDPYNGGDSDSGNLMDLLFNTNLEWLSLNWRKYRASLMASTLKKLIFHMYEEDYQYFPNLREIRDGLILAQQ